MTVQNELDSDAQQMEYILCIEGIGWPSDETDFSQGFDGDVFVTNDIEGDLATQLGCTIHKGLVPPRGFEDKLDSKRYRYEHGGIRLQVVDVDSFFVSAIAPLYQSGKKGKLNAELTFRDTELHIDNANETWSTGEVIWVAGREAIKLGTRTFDKVTNYTYPDSTRGYLGTPRGKHDHRPVPGAKQFAWQDETRIDDFCRYWYDRQVLVLMHVPGEGPGKAKRLYRGRIRSLPVKHTGNIWSFSTSFEPSGGHMRRVYYAPKSWYVAREEWLRVGVGSHSDMYHETGYVPAEDYVLDEPRNYRRWLALNHRDVTERYDVYGLIFSYLYRNRVAGGTESAVTEFENNWSTTTPQAVQDSNSRYRLDKLLNIGGQFLRILHKSDGANYRSVICQSINAGLGSVSLDSLEDADIRFMLDNRLGKHANPFTVNNRVTYNPIDVLLIFLTSENYEYYRNSQASGSDPNNSSTPHVQFNNVTFTTDAWVGYALHCVEGDNKGEARVISSNTSNEIFVDRPFSNAGANGNEYQIRNTIYDVLPFGWGMGLHNSRIDIDSFEEVRERFLADAEIGKFAIGDTDEFDLWEFLQSNICQLYGLLTRHNRLTGKLESKFLSETVTQDGLVEDYTLIEDKDILWMGEIQYLPQSPATELAVEIRSRHNVAVRPIMVHENPTIGAKWFDGYEKQTINSLGVGGRTEEHIIKIDEKDSSFEDGVFQRLSIRALLHDIDTFPELIPRLQGRLKRAARPAPRVELRVGLKYLDDLQTGDLIIINDNSNWDPVNPYTAARGWVNTACRIISTSIELSQDQPGLKLTCEILAELTQGKFAPACEVTGKGNDGTYDYFTVENDNFRADPDKQDWEGMAVGDDIVLRNEDGTAVEVEEIAAFGSNHSSTPEGASDDRINVVGTISATVTTGDYVTFTGWASGQSNNMDNYSALADEATDDLNGDSPRTYGG